MSIEFVAEHIMGFKRECCQGSMGGGNTNADGGSTIWFWCNWCWRKVLIGENRPCPKYPFPKFTLVDLMRRLGERACTPTMVRFDTLRKERKFTITNAEGRVCDTDNPLEDYCAYLAEKYKAVDDE